MKKEQAEDYIEIDLLKLALVLWRRAWAIVLVMLLCGGVAFSYAYFWVTPTYQASTLLYVNNTSISVGSTSISLSDLSASQSLVDTYIVILKTRLTLNEVIRRGELTDSYEDLYEKIDASAVNATEIFEVTVTDTDPVKAKEIANTIAEVLPEKISEIVDGSSVRVVDYAVVPDQKYEPSITKYTAIGLVLGFLLSCGIIILKELLNDRVSDEEDLLRAYNLPILAVIPNLNHSRGGKPKEEQQMYYDEFFAAAGEEELSDDHSDNHSGDNRESVSDDNKTSGGKGYARKEKTE